MVEKIRSFASHLTRLMKPSFVGSGGIYVILILGLVSGLSFLLTGGLVPQIERNPENPEVVDILVDLSPVAQQNLQMRNIQAVPTPTFSPTPTGSPSAFPTPSVVACLDNSAIAIVVDISGSMGGPASAGNNERKVDVLKRALNTFLSNVPTDTVVGLFAYATEDSVLVPFGPYGINSQALTQQINALTPSSSNPLGASTNTADGLSLVYNNIIQAKQQFPGSDFSVIFLSDGVPENRECLFVDATEEYRADDGDGEICASSFTTHPQYPVPVANAIKQLGANVFTVAIYKEPPYTSGTQAEIVQMMQDTASDPNSTYYIGLPNADNLEAAYSAITNRLCS